jgi:hypothetical protein
MLAMNGTKGWTTKMNAKEKAAINMLNRGMSVSEVARKTGLCKCWLQLQKERVV